LKNCSFYLIVIPLCLSQLLFFNDQFKWTVSIHLLETGSSCHYSILKDLQMKKKLYVAVTAWTALAVTTVPVFAGNKVGNAIAGKTKAVMCAACHGANGYSVNPLSPNLAGQTAAYILQQLKAFQKNQRIGQTMNPIAQQLTKQDMTDLAAYYASLGGNAGTQGFGGGTMAGNQNMGGNMPNNQGMYRNNPNMGGNMPYNNQGGMTYGRQMGNMPNNQGMYQNPNRGNMPYNQGMYQNPNRGNMPYNQGMYQNPNRGGNMPNQGMYQNPNRGMPNNQGMYQNPNRGGNMPNQGMYQNPNMGGNMMPYNQGMYQNPNRGGNMMPYNQGMYRNQKMGNMPYNNQGMFQNPNMNMGNMPNNQGMYQNPNMGNMPNNQGMYQNPNMGNMPNNQGMYQNPNMGNMPNNQGMYQNSMGMPNNQGMYQNPNMNMGNMPNNQGMYGNMSTSMPSDFMSNNNLTMRTGETFGVVMGDNPADAEGGMWALTAMPSCLLLMDRFSKPLASPYAGAGSPQQQVFVFKAQNACRATIGFTRRSQQGVTAYKTYHVIVR
jgi:cytochrome c553